MSARIEAAGVVLVRPGDDGPQVAVVHRPHRSDWSLPKGKLEDGERHRDAALREVWEETGLRCSLGDRLVEIRYPTPRGEDKRVRWWAMTVDSDDGFRPGRETDERRWVPLDDVDGLLSWDTDRTVLERFRSGSDA